LVTSTDEIAPHRRQHALTRVATVAREGTSPLERLEFSLHPWVAFLIMPLFALANAGVSVEAARLVSPVALAIAAGLVVGKPIGILAFCWIATRFRFARLPSEANWTMMLGAACLCGVGFTMSIFIAGLALPDDLLDDGKIGTLVGSTISGLFGCVVLFFGLRAKLSSASNSVSTSPVEE
jgi:NhaA family Na+:H+ antiporter